MSFSVLVLRIYPFSIRMSLLILFIAYSWPSFVLTTWKTLPKDPLSITLIILKSSKASPPFFTSSFWTTCLWAYINSDFVLFINASSDAIFSALLTAFTFFCFYFCLFSISMGSMNTKSLKRSSTSSLRSSNILLSCLAFFVEASGSIKK